ncbi:M28 family metallopeptidase [Pseudonocardia sp. TRM90224]|uniref:M28 family metallopeptidase n=1 Tax=Pseudonocardia sp. TRM90224 TaxID=2812678 RepID=UPI001E3F3D80|nr:M28 family metallopeptidase [Pseudonocardia sp. TRM90224]
MPPNAPRIVVAVAAVLLGAACAGPAAPATAPPQNPSTSPIDHLTELQRIADTNGGNRALGSPGYDASVEYVAGVLRTAGFQVTTPEFSAFRFSVQQEKLTVAGAEVPAKALSFSPTTPEAGITAPLTVTTGEGCDAAALGTVAPGSVVLVKRGTCPFGQKSAVAKAAGAAALIVSNNEDAPLDSATLGQTPDTVPTAGVSRADGEALAGKAGASVTVLLRTTTEEARSRNVIAQTTTGNTAEVVMTGAHLDSVPEGPGINDNGSGVAALLTSAQRLGGAPAVTNAVRFGFWGAEEVGLVGSTAYVESVPEAERGSIALYLNFDMVGSPNAAYFVYDGDDSDKKGEGPGPAGSATVERALAEALTGAGVPSAGTDFDGRSDYKPFIDAGIPAGGIFTGAESIKTPEEAQRWGGAAGTAYDKCYHQACDKIDNVDRTALDRNTDVVTAVLNRFAQSTSDLNG